jgi:hypothetical protein
MLKTFNTTQQQYGDFFAGYAWTIFGCGTFRRKLASQHAISILKMYMRELGITLKARIPYIAVPEYRHSGCGLPAIPLHVHFLAACPPQWEETFHVIAGDLWETMAGNSQVVPYDPTRGAAHYIAKLTSSADFEWLDDNLGYLPYTGPSDLIAAAQNNPYVPEHAKGFARLNTLVVRKRGSD